MKNPKKKTLREALGEAKNLIANLQQNVEWHKDLLTRRGKELATLEVHVSTPVPMTLWCPACRKRHIDTGTFATMAHHTHSCQFCGLTWRPAVVPTVGVRFLPGFKNP